MKISTVFQIVILSGTLTSCGKPAEKAATGLEEIYDCNTIRNYRVLYKIAKSIIDAPDNSQIWNLHDVDTTDVFIMEDYFISSKSKHLLIRMDGEAGMSSGTANNLMMIASCADGIKVIWSGQVGEFSQSDIRDLNNDGIKEIVIRASMMWMGECNSSFSIINFVNGIENTIFSRHSRSVVDCGFDNHAELSKSGDTLVSNYECEVEYAGSNVYEVNQVRTIKISKGGQTDDEVINNLAVITDTTRIKLK